VTARRFRALYGAGPLHLLGVAASFTLGAYALVRFLGSGPVLDLVVWLLAAVALHDFVLFPAYSALDRVLSSALGGGEERPRLINHLRVPSMLSAVLFLVYFPLILGIDRGLFAKTTGASVAPYLGRWLLVTAGLFVLSALLYLGRLARRRRAPPATSAPSAARRRAG